MEKFTKSAIMEKVGEMDGATPTMTFILYDDSIYDRDFEKVLVSGIDTTNFQKNPVMLVQHASYCAPIGKWENLRIEGSKLLADAVFDETSLNEDDLIIIDKIKKGFIKAVSIGFMPKSEPIKFVPQPGTPEAAALSVSWRNEYRIWEKTELYEASIVTLPSNPNAVRIKSLQTKAGASISAANKARINECMMEIDACEKALNSTRTKLNLLIGEQEDEMEEDGFNAIKNIEDKLNKLLAIHEPAPVQEVTTDETIQDEQPAEEVVSKDITLEELKHFLLLNRRDD